MYKKKIKSQYIRVECIFYSLFLEWTKYNFWMDFIWYTIEYQLALFFAHRSPIIGNLSPRIFTPQKWYWLEQVGTHNRRERVRRHDSFIVRLCYHLRARVFHTKELWRWEVQSNKNGSKNTTARAGTSSSLWYLLKLNCRTGRRQSLLILNFSFLKNKSSRNSEINRWKKL